MPGIDPLNIFSNYFDLEIAVSPQEKKEQYQLRYQVFCKEFGFEKESDCYNKNEIDCYDDQSIHLNLYHKPTGLLVGCLRLILPHLSLTQGLPFEQFCFEEQLPLNQAEITRFGEASRLAVHPNFRRRHCDGHHLTGVNLELRAQRDTIPVRAFPIVAMSMMLSGAAIARLMELDRLYAMMEPKLAYVLTKYGLYFEQIGHLTNYHGERAPFSIQPEKIWDTVKPELAPLLDHLYQTLNKAMPDERIA